MNIIQIQDRLKGVPDNALIGYVENPTGDVPTYLALGELGRREEMRKKYAQEAAPTETVAEEIVAKAQPQMGLGALTSNMQDPMVAPQEEVMSESVTETGVATLPAPNIGQNYAGGGIVYTDGTQGYPIGGLIAPIISGGARILGGTALGQGIKRGVGSLFRSAKDAVKTPSAVVQRGIPNAPGKNITIPQPGPGRPAIGPGYFRQPGSLLDTAVIGGITYTLLPDGKIVDEEGNPPPPEVTNTITEQLTETVTEPAPAPQTDEAIARERMDMYKSLLGEDEGQSAIAERLEKIESRAQGREDQALNDALIRGGLRTAAGTSQNFLENLATGATAGIDSYDKSLDDMGDSEKEIFAIEVELNKAKRAEQIAIASKGIDSIEARTAAKEARALQTQKDNAYMQRILAQAAAGVVPNESDIMSAFRYRNDFEQTYEDFREEIMRAAEGGVPDGITVTRKN